MSQPEPVYDLDTTTGATTLDEVQNVLDQMWSAHPEVPDMVRIHVDLAVAEIAANIMEHSAQGRAVRLRMTAGLADDQVRIEFTDNGRPTEVDLDAVDLPELMAESGRGLALAQRVLDELSYRRDSTGNHWVLVRRTVR